MSPVYHYRSPLARRAASLLERILRAIPSRKRPLPPPGSVRRILLVKPDHLGDVFLALPVLPLVREHFPQARIDFVANEEGARLLSGEPLVGKVHIHEHFLLQRSGAFPGKALLHLRTFFAAACAIRREGYDLCLLLRSHFDNDLFLALAGRCGFIAGHGTDGFGPLLDGEASWKEGVHETRHALEVLEATGMDVPDRPLPPRLAADAGDVAVVERILAQHGLSPGNFVVLHPGTGNPAKQWGSGKWRELARRMAEAGLRIAVTGSGAESGLASEIAGGIPGIADLSGSLTVRQLAVLLRSSQRLVCLDSLAAHLGSAAGTETFVICSGISDPSRWAPVGPNVRLLRKEAECAPCGIAEGCASMRCIDLSPEEVFRAVCG